MTEENNHKNTPEARPEAEIRTKRRFASIWVGPLVALVIGGYLLYKAWSETGPTITITFETATGLEAGKTKIKYKAVEVGRVESIDLPEDLSKVVVTAKMVREAKDYLEQVLEKEWTREGIC